MDQLKHDLVMMLAPMLASALVAGTIRALGWANEEWAKRLLAVLFDAAGATKKGASNAKRDET
jgi:hypothetical protein